MTAAPVVIVGGGFGGLYTALALAARRSHPPILLIEPNERFLFLPLLYELLSGEVQSWEIAPRYDTLLAGKGVAWLKDRVSRIDGNLRIVETASGQKLPYSRLVIATGARVNSFGIPGVEEHCLGFRSLADVEQLQALVAQLRRTQRPLQRLAVVGAGASGVELACKLADSLAGSAAVELIEQGETLLPAAKSFNREQANLALVRKDVRLRLRTQVVGVAAGQLSLQTSAAGQAGGPAGPPSLENLAVNGVIWTAGLKFEAPSIEPPAATDRRGRLLCQADLQLLGHPNLFALGDIAQLEGDEPLAATAQVAFQQAENLAANLPKSLAGEALEPFQYNDLGEMMSLGEGDAALTGAGLTLAGPAAFQLRRLAYLSRLPSKGHQLRVATGWLSNTSWLSSLNWLAKS
ncbi:FAD-dependent oxidoreductase [Cyanobium sp. HWJ4-Hawea]|uniref:NAD(P)/FAD-dependent oxidoreductase n=1 Tax=Cyanobium sp. HWJ4-Hawea TaxID=2823713 RepID=UPI0020CBB8A8|nr:FAD-dependent oxidoreductase [Cyanobium sp. HWJ4-Hawea]MCP9809755.1 FAD-dependent oxidoreductase [Cyanobium sp. HWJ4-Hawea]